MINDVVVTAETLDQALQQAGERFGVPLYALEYETLPFGSDDLLSNAEEPEEIAIRVTVKLDYLVERAEDQLRRLLAQMTYEVEIDAEIHSSLIHLSITSEDDNASLIGHRGETLEALEYIVNRMLARGGMLAPPVIVDIQNYRFARIRELEDMIQQRAVQAIDSGKEVQLAPMESGERKLVHALLTEFKGIKTFSRGLDRERHIVLAADGAQPDAEQLDEVRRRMKDRPARPRRDQPRRDRPRHDRPRRGRGGQGRQNNPRRKT